MNDITVCEGTDCILKKNCKRYKSKPFELLQSYYLEIPFKNDKCIYQLKKK